MALSVIDRTFTQEVLESSTPVLVYFSAPWCGLCRMINPLLTRFKSQWGLKVKVVSINADENLRLVNTYRLKTLPTLIFFEHGEVVYRLENFQGRDDVKTALDKIIVNSLPHSA